MVLISFDCLRKIHNFKKFEGCGSKIEPATPISILKFRGMWQGQVWCHTLEILKKCVFSKGKQMILLSFFYNSSQKCIIWKRLISVCKIRPASVQNRLFCTEAGLKWQNEIGFSWFKKIWLELSKNDNNIICLSLKDTQFFKILKVWLKNWAYYAYFKFEL